MKPKDSIFCKRKFKIWPNIKGTLTNDQRLKKIFKSGKILPNLITLFVDGLQSPASFCLFLFFSNNFAEYKL